MSEQHCNCPSMDDVFSPHVPIYTKEPCPVHPESDWLGKVQLLPATRFEINLESLNKQVREVLGE